jgi:hypothetical protein
MGVATKKWGPRAWIFLHAIALLIRRKRDGVALFRALRYVLPCIYCRRSFASFLPGLLAGAAKGRSIDWPLLVYLAHTRVNMKLYTQDAEAGKSLRKWVAYAPPQEDVPALSEAEWSGHMCAFLLFALHDYEASRARAMVRFLDVLTRILTRAEVSFASAWFETWQRHRAQFLRVDHAQRVRGGRELEACTRAPMCSYDEACARCEAGVVRCVVAS